MWVRIRLCNCVGQNLIMQLCRRHHIHCRAEGILWHVLAEPMKITKEHVRGVFGHERLVSCWRLSIIICCYGCF